MYMICVGEVGIVEMNTQEEIPKAELFKDRKAILTPDFRISYDNTDEKYFNLFYEAIAKITLNSQVPQKILLNFETSRNTLLYSYYCYRMSAPATLYLLSTLEMALTVRARTSSKEFKDRDGLNEKFKYAFNQHWLDIKKLAPTGALNNVKDWLYYAHNDYVGYYVNLRNDLAHGSSGLDTPLLVCDLFSQIAQIINMLFDDQFFIVEGL